MDGWGVRKRFRIGSTVVREVMVRGMVVRSIMMRTGRGKPKNPGIGDGEVKSLLFRFAYTIGFHSDLLSDWVA